MPFATRLGRFFPDERDLVIAEALFIQPVGARDFLEGIDGSLDAFSPGDSDELDVAMDISDSKDPQPTRLVVRIGLRCG